MSEPTFFKTPAQLRNWFRKHGCSKTELHLGYYKKGTGFPSVTWPESVDEALCVGWIDGVRHSIDAQSYRIRFTPRKPNSHWSAVNIKRVAVLMDEGRMQPTGIEAFNNRSESKSKLASYEQDGEQVLPQQFLKELKKQKAAFQFFEKLPPGHRKQVIWWVISAKKEETQIKRFEKLLEACVQQTRMF